jgi:hypothetical protein
MLAQELDQTYRAVTGRLLENKAVRFETVAGKRNWCSVPWTSWRSRRRWSRVMSLFIIAGLSVKRPTVINVSRRGGSSVRSVRPTQTISQTIATDRPCSVRLKPALCVADRSTSSSVVDCRTWACRSLCTNGAMLHVAAVTNLGRTSHVRVRPDLCPGLSLCPRHTPEGIAVQMVCSFSAKSADNLGRPVSN